MMMLRGLRFESVGKMDFDENGEIDLSFALRMGAYRMPKWESCKVEATLECINGILARPSKFYKSIMMLEEIEHFRVSFSINSKRFRVSALVWYVLVTTRFRRSKMKLTMAMVMAMS
jgi:hypothetical protein